MAITWDWTDKMGECEMQGKKLNLYRGNAFCIALNEFTNEEGTEQYYMEWFAADEEHMKNMLGLKKDYDNIMEDWGITAIRLDTRYKETAKMVQLFARARMNITIELYERGKDNAANE